MNLFAFILISLFPLFSLSKRLDSKLLLTQILYRHGDRNIIYKCPLDPYVDEKYWPGGYEQLTMTGMQQHFKLGRWLRERYRNLLPNGFSVNNTYVVSTDVDRTLMSAASNLAGFFPPKEEQFWNEKLLWQPIPIHAIPDYVDTMLDSKIPCPLFDHLQKQYEGSRETQRMHEKYTKLFPFLTQYCGREILTMDEAYQIYDILLVEQFHNYSLDNLHVTTVQNKHYEMYIQNSNIGIVVGGSISQVKHQWSRLVLGWVTDWLPDWAPEVLKPLREISLFSFEAVTATPKMALLKGGFFVRHILDIFAKKAEAMLYPDRSIFVYSAHDNTLTNVLRALGLFDSILPPYASCILFELHESAGEFYLQIFYKKIETDDLPPPLYIPNCGTKCPLSKFYEIYKEIIPTKSYNEECRMSV